MSEGIAINSEIDNAPIRGLITPVFALCTNISLSPFRAVDK